MSSTPTAWKMDGLELSPQEKLNWLYAKCAELQEEISQAGGSTVSVTAEYTEQTYNNKLATITVDSTATKIYAPKVTVTPTTSESTPNTTSLGSISVGSTSKTIRTYITLKVNDFDGALNVGYADLTDYTNGMLPGCVLIMSAVDAVTGDETYNIYPLEKLWSETVQDETTYYAKFGSRTYSAASEYDPLEITT